jgi:hypothetical protein
VTSRISDLSEERLAPLPFEAYPSGGRTLLGKPKGDLARRGYGRDALSWCGFRCAYCGLDMAIFEGWLQLSIDHVVPQQATAAGFPAEWILDGSNVVACCRSCNDLFNRDPVIDPVPSTLESFFDLRDRLYLARRQRIIERRAAERMWFEENVTPQAAKAAAPPAVELFSRAWLESSGFEGFVSVGALQQSLEDVPRAPGVYVVLAASPVRSTFLSRSVGGHFKQRDPTVASDVLRARWREGVPILYIGKANAIRSRVKLLVRFAAGEPVGHWGGRYLWQVAGSGSFLVAWREHPQPRAFEADLLRDFAAHFGTMPFANLQG